MALSAAEISLPPGTPLTGGAAATLRASEGVNGSSSALEALPQRAAGGGGAAAGRPSPLKLGGGPGRPQTPPPPTFDAAPAGSLPASPSDFEVGPVWLPLSALLILLPTPFNCNPCRPPELLYTPTAETCRAKRTQMGVHAAQPQFTWRQTHIIEMCWLRRMRQLTDMTTTCRTCPRSQRRWR